MEQNANLNNSIALLFQRLEALEKENAMLKKKVNMLIVEQFSEEIIEMVNSSDLKRLQEIIEQNDYPINENFSKRTDASNTNLLVYSAAHDKSKIVKYLCSLPSLDVNVVDKKEQWNALMYAIENKNLAMATDLLEKNIDINIQDVDGFSPLIIAIDIQSEAMIRLMLQHKPKEESIDNVKSFISSISNLEIKKLVMDYFNIKNVEEDNDADDDDDDKDDV